MTRRICEELAAEQGTPAVTPELIREAEAEAETESAAAPLPWTPEAEARLVARLGKAPAMMADFVLRLFQRDVEVEARRPATRRSPPRWSSGSGRPRRRRRSLGPEAWARLQTAPEFVREGIRKAAERRARRMGVAEIDSPLLTRFRNQAMMKAVKADPRAGLHRAHLRRVRRRQGRDPHRQPEPRSAGAARPHPALLRDGAPRRARGFPRQDLMRRFRAHLKDPAAAPLDTSDEGSGA
jgi:hypothetical protein